MNFLRKYFIEPIYNPGRYNIYNTAAYLVIFLFVVYYLYKLLEKLKIEIDRKFFYSFYPLLFFGIFLRIQVDYRFLKPSPLTVTPGPWILTFLIFLFEILVLYKKNWKYCLYLNLFIFIFSVFIFKFVFSIFYLFYLPFALLPLFLKDFKKIAVLGQLTDLISSYIAVKIGYSEEHVLTFFLVSISPELYFLIRLLLILLIVYLIDKKVKEKNFKNYLFLIIFVLGFGPGSRNWLILRF